MEESTDIQPAEEAENLATFTEQQGPFSIKVLPVIRDTGTDWRIKVYGQGIQGPVYESTSRMTDDVANWLGIGTDLQERINGALAYADENLDLPKELGDQSRSKRSLDELSRMAE